MEYQPLYHIVKTRLMKEDTVKARRSLSDSWELNFKNIR